MWVQQRLYLLCKLKAWVWQAGVDGRRTCWYLISHDVVVQVRLYAVQLQRQYGITFVASWAV
jgi:hypothetical protein